MVNLVELVADREDCLFDQPCKFGHRVESHAVYCHHDKWDDSPRKCRRTWYTGGEVKDEDCAGFEVNPVFTGKLEPSIIFGQPCSRCHARKLIDTDDGKVETCPLCIGSGAEPEAIPLSEYEQNTLELGTTHSGRHDTAGYPFVRIAENKTESASIDKLVELRLVELRSVSFARPYSVYLLENTMKGEAVMRKNWKANA